MTAPMPGTIIDFAVKQGDEVSAGDKLVTMEAMKMEHTIRAPGAGVVESFYYAAGDLVDGGAELLQFTALEE